MHTFFWPSHILLGRVHIRLACTMNSTIEITNTFPKEYFHPPIKFTLTIHGVLTHSCLHACAANVIQVKMWPPNLQQEVVCSHLLQTSYCHHLS